MLFCWRACSASYSSGCSLGAPSGPVPLSAARQTLRIGLVTGDPDIQTLDPAETAETASFDSAPASSPRCSFRRC